MTAQTAAPPLGIARFDSAAGMAQALALALHGREFRSLTGSPVLDSVLPAVNLLPRRLREWFYSFSGMVEALPADKLRQLDVGRIARWLTGLYPDRTFPAAFIGSSNGATVHLGAALGAPWLSQTLLCPVRNLGADADDANEGFAAGASTVAHLLETEPDLSVHHMHDPNQDRLMLRTMSYFRLKHRRLPAAYRAALTRWLPRGATLYVVNCTRRWPVTRTGPRSVFQFGAVGGATIDEYQHGGERVRAYFSRYHVDRARWDPPEPNDTAPEAEWGYDPALDSDLDDLAHAQGWSVIELRFEDPEAMSDVTAALHQDWYADLGHQPPHHLLVDSFVLMAPLRTQRLRAIPLWLLFSVQPSADHLARYLDQQPQFDRIDLMLFSHGTEGVGLAPVETWQHLAARGRQPGRLLGVDPRHYPRDFATFARFHRDLETLGPVHAAPPLLDLERFETLLRRHAAHHGVTLIARTSDR